MIATRVLRDRVIRPQRALLFNPNMTRYLRLDNALWAKFDSGEQRAQELDSRYLAILSKWITYVQFQATYFTF